MVDPRQSGLACNLLLSVVGGVEGSMAAASIEPGVGELLR